MSRELRGVARGFCLPAKNVSRKLSQHGYLERTVVATFSLSYARAVPLADRMSCYGGHYLACFMIKHIKKHVRCTFLLKTTAIFFDNIKNKTRSKVFQKLFKKISLQFFNFFFVFLVTLRFDCFINLIQDKLQIVYFFNEFQSSRLQPFLGFLMTFLETKQPSPLIL